MTIVVEIITQLIFKVKSNYLRNDLHTGSRYYIVCIVVYTIIYILTFFVLNMIQCTLYNLYVEIVNNHWFYDRISYKYYIL